MSNLPSAPTLKLEMGSFYIPKDNPSKPLGEDAHFISADKQTAGVADGVGGWVTKGIDAGEYARELISNCAVAVDASTEAPAGDFLQTVLHTAFHMTTVARGTSTVCIVRLDGDELRSVYVGDSGFMVFRRYECIYKSPVQQQEFNCPNQLGREPGSDEPGVALCPSITVMAGDIVVVGTDGLMDNLFVEEIERVLEAVAETATPESLASQLAMAAMYNSYDENFVSPFSVAVRAAGRMQTGGKIDDITVIVGRVVCAEAES
ncbi:probable protein phosphatase 2C 55 [Benincasa hispida]|uniref:probable protein phosphatase 2C 55 n=1 Tax=Benincasa hispida TaxID=102211 RepID=UPI0019011347|nr:probable protein phosphatase 2C 55 [Benincasa hispida]